jgi:hypothetical protein
MPSILRFAELLSAAILACALSLPVSSQAFGDDCTYETWDWDTIQKKATNRRRISKPKSDLTQEERGLTEGCSVCEEDQVELQIESLPAFKACKVFRARIERAVKKAVSEGFPITSIVGYRVGKSKGPLNSSGQRTQFSNHSFGTALDFNSEKNGLYDSCIQFGPGCKLLRGGGYRPELPGAVTRGSGLYQSMTAEGFKWGGEIVGKQKDFMHFSLTGM